MTLRNTIKNLMPTKIRRAIRRSIFTDDPFATLSWSQEGEDLVLRRLLKGRTKGFYVDVGAHHPTRFSNTYYFYCQGWHGINIDAQPGSMNLFREHRPRDMSIEVAISSSRGTLPFYSFSAPELNGFSRTTVLPAADAARFALLGVTDVITLPLADVLDEHAPKTGSIDFLNVDVEGHDLVVLESNNWNLYRPHWIIAELGSGSLQAVTQSPLSTFLADVGYTLFSRTYNSGFFRRNDVEVAV